MYIQNATYKAVPSVGLTFPLAEGTVLTVGDVTGVVPENIYLAAPTGMIYLAVGGTIDLTSEANSGVTFTDEQIKALGSDFNFIPAQEIDAGAALPEYGGYSDSGKILAVNSDGNGLEWVNGKVPNASTDEYGYVLTASQWGGGWRPAAGPVIDLTASHEDGTSIQKSVTVVSANNINVTAYLSYEEMEAIVNKLYSNLCKVKLGRIEYSSQISAYVVNDDHSAEYPVACKADIYGVDIVVQYTDNSNATQIAMVHINFSTEMPI